MPSKGLRIVTNCVGQHLVMGRVPLGHRATFTRWGWGYAVSTRYNTRTRMVERGSFFTTDTALATQTARALGIPFETA